MATKPKRIEDMSEAELNRLSTAAYDKAMPSPEPGEKAPRKVDNFPRQAAVIRQGFEDKAKAEMAREKDRADKGATFKENMEAGRMDEMGNAYKKGGMVSSASRRADGCATKGKTRGRVL